MMAESKVVNLVVLQVAMKVNKKVSQLGFLLGWMWVACSARLKVHCSVEKMVAVLAVTWDELTELNLDSDSAEH